MVKQVIDQISRYLHIIYAPNIPGVHVLEESSRPYLNELARQANSKFKLEDIETLIDYFSFSEEFRRSSYGRKVNLIELGTDIAIAGKWKQSNETKS